MALSTRLTQHCLRRKKSPTNFRWKHSGGCTDNTSSTPRLDAFWEMSVRCSTSRLGVNASELSSTCSRSPSLPAASASFSRALELGEIQNLVDQT